MKVGSEQRGRGDSSSAGGGNRWERGEGEQKPLRGFLPAQEPLPRFQGSPHSLIKIGIYSRRFGAIPSLSPAFPSTFPPWKPPRARETPPVFGVPARDGAVNSGPGVNSERSFQNLGIVVDFGSMLAVISVLDAFKSLNTCS